MYINLLTIFSNIINNINIDWTIRISDIISVWSVITTIVIAFITIHKNINKQLSQQQYNLQKQLETSKKNHIENKNIELRKNQIEYLPIIDMVNINCSSDGKKIIFNVILKNIGNGIARNCFLSADEKLVVYNDSVDPELQYIQSSPGTLILNANDSFATSIRTSKLPNDYPHKESFSITYDDLMGRKYKQLFVFHYTYPKLSTHITNKYEWECVQNIEFKP